MENPQKIDRDSGLPFCVFHMDRVEHFYCKAHQVIIIIFRALVAESVLKLVMVNLIVKLLTSIMKMIPTSI